MAYTSSYNYKPNQTPYTKPMTIWDAYNNNVFGRSKVDEDIEEGSDEWNKQNEEVEQAKRNRNYMIVDALSKGLRGIGKDISNVGAAFTGGTMQDSTPETSAWDARNAELIKQGISAESKNVGGSDAAMNAASKEAEIMGQYKDLTSKDLANELANKKLILPREYAELIENADSIESPILRSAVRGSAAVMLNKYVNGGEVKAADIIGSIVANGGGELEKEAKEAGKSVEEYIGDAVQSMSGGLLGEGGVTVNASLNPFGNENTNPEPSHINPYTKEKRFSKGETDPSSTYKNMLSMGFLEGTPYDKFGSLGDAYAYAKKNDNYEGSKDEAFTNWLYRRYKDKKQATYDELIN